MGRSRSPIGRALVGFLVIVVIAIVAVVYLKRPHKDAAPATDPGITVATEKQPLSPTKAVNPTEPAASGTGALVTQTPTTETPAAPAPAPAAPVPAPAPAISISDASTRPSPVVTSADLASALSSAKSKADAGDLLAARNSLNDAILSGRLSDSDANAAKRTIAELNKTIIFSNRRFPGDSFGGTYQVKRGDLLAKIANAHQITAGFLSRINGISDPRKLRAGATIKAIHGPFHAVVYKKRFLMEIYLGSPGGKDSMFVCSFPVGLGQEDSTPTGKWIVEPGKKLTNPTYYSPRGGGVIEADDPQNPLGEYWISLVGIDGDAVGKPSYGIHGTIDPSSIGKQASLGCIRMLNDDVARVYEMLVEGKSTVLVKE